MSKENDHDKSPNRFSWLKPKQSDKQDSASITTAEKRTSPDLRVPLPAETPKPVSIVTLFRYVFFPPPPPVRIVSPPSVTSYSTRFELCLNAIGLFAAIVAGAAQVCRVSVSR